LLRELAQESEQNWRLRKAVRSSKRPPAKTFRWKRAPQIEQRFSGVGFTSARIDYFLREGFKINAAH